MKKLNYLFFMAASLLAVSCAEEDVVIDTGSKGPGNLNVTVNLPKSFNTRSLGDGLAATTLNVALYDASDDSLISTTTADFDNSLTTTVSFNLVNGKSYKLAFFATSENSQTTNPVYDFDAQNHTLTVDYANMQSAANTGDAYDCFYAVYATGTMTSTQQNISVTLNRPVAQVNWGTDDLTSNAVTEASAFGANAAYLRTSLSTEAYTSLDLLDGTVSGQESISIDNFVAPTGTFPVTGYNYVGMYYLLAPYNTSAVYDLKLTISNSGGTDVTPISYSVSVNSAPVQGNYQTNIYGTLLSNDVEFTVTKDATWNTPAFDEPLTWDGSVTQPTVDTSAKTVTVNRPSDLAGLAQMVSGSNGQEANDFENYTISLAADFDMADMEFPMIGSATRDGASTTSTSTSFKGIFDGNNHTISNMVINGTSNADDAAGFIGSLSGSSAMIKDVTFSNLQINAPQNQQAGVVGLLTEGATVSNVTVSSGSVTAAEAGGGIVGRMMLNGTVTQCENHATINSGTNAGGIVGAAYRTTPGQTCTVQNCKNFGNVIATSQAAGGVVGLSSAEVSGCSNAGTIVGNASAVGGVVGQQNYAGSISGCSNTGKVTGGGSSTGSYGTGGIVGWVRYSPENESAYAAQNVITVTSCNNSGAVTGQTGVGGIVGVWYTCGICAQNTNTAPTISGYSFVAGIVGDSQWTESGPTLATDGNTDMLYVANNYSSTPLSAITGSNTSEYVYMNNTQKTTQSGNSQTDASVVDTPFTPSN